MSTLHSRFGALTSEEVSRLDRAAVECGVMVMQLMELAGWQVARLAWRVLEGSPGTVAVVAGRGNNGGDGLVAARHLAGWGCTVRAAVISDPNAVSGLVAQQLEAARRCGVAAGASPDVEQLGTCLDGADLVIDAMLGTGLSTPPRSPQAAAIRLVNESSARVLSVDVPSGLDATTGETRGACVDASSTCTLAAVKAGLWTAKGRAHAGEILVADIGMPAAAWQRCDLEAPTEVRGGRLSPIPTLTPP